MSMLTTMKFASLRRRCEARLRELAIASPFDLEAFCRSVEERRGRPIRLVSVPGRGGPHGLWVASPSADYIFYERDTSASHQQHIILHELSHLLCDHRLVRSTAAEPSPPLFPDLQPEMVQSVLARTAYSTDDEREAELLASLILERVAGSRDGETDDGMGTTLRRIAAYLGGA